MTAPIGTSDASTAAEKAAAQKAAAARAALDQSGEATASAESKPVISADFNMFLKLLTSQIQNQNPLSPMDTAQFTNQLVQFAQTEQSIQQNSTLKTILGKLTSQELAQASSYIGRDARFDTQVAGLTADKPANWSYQYNQVPAALVAEIKDSKGSVVKTIALSPATKGKIAWDGSTSLGGKAPEGNYTLSLVAKDVNGATINGAVTAAGTISSAMMLDGRTIVTVNGANYPLDALLSVDTARAAGSA
ncbi:flagellar hook assembly protein FlgD [Sphingomonas yunnanensis]|uniref:flagellar hook assembly protein FlgD n=1 Tax=Sphingomonas yunnanensis TaxID=310400 RepID=UPI001CA5F87C|nr:flagellar hook capping FlgD N-terminal domain-containing protein [Sphingomonas yunnanensis]MBY9062183.1 flagellar hook assembly protein FlgD [Sphingomonas yunnanensis]